MSKELHDLSDEDLLVALAEGEPAALDVLYSRHSGRVLTYALKRGLSQDRSEDLVQIVFMQVYRKKHLYDAKYSALAWIYVISRSELKDYRNRELKNFEELPAHLSQNDDVTPIKEEAHALLGQLKDREQEVMRLRYLDEMEYQEIAKILDESESNIRQIVSRSVKFLKGLSTKKGETR